LEVWGQSPQLPEARGSGGRPPELGDFSIKVTYFMHILEIVILKQ